MPFTFTKLEIPDVILIEPKIFKDDRGFFIESYKKSEFFEFGIKEEFIQDNHSKSVYGVIRGLHYQTNPKAQAKLVRCTKGTIFDVAVDIRVGSPTYGKWIGELLSEDNKKLLYIPVGFAHGFSVLSETAELLYKTTEEYAPENDAAIFYADPEINIDWKVSDPIISDKDKHAPVLKFAKNHFTMGLFFP